MLNEKICRLRDKLNDSITKGADYSIIYKLSVELDQLIAEYYKNGKYKYISNKERDKAYYKYM